MRIKTILKLAPTFLLTFCVFLSTQALATATPDFNTEPQAQAMETQVPDNEITIIGTMNDDMQLVTDQGVAYEIDDTEKGYEVLNLVGKKLSIIGIISDDDDEDDIKIITVISYKPLDL